MSELTKYPFIRKSITTCHGHMGPDPDSTLETRLTLLHPSLANRAGSVLSALSSLLAAVCSEEGEEEMGSLVFAKALTRSLLHRSPGVPKSSPLSQLMNFSKCDSDLLSCVRTLTSLCFSSNFPNWQYQSRRTLILEPTASESVKFNRLSDSDSGTPHRMLARLFEHQQFGSVYFLFMGFFFSILSMHLVGN